MSVDNTIIPYLSSRAGAQFIAYKSRYAVSKIEKQYIDMLHELNAYISNGLIPSWPHTTACNLGTENAIVKLFIHKLL